MKRLLIQKPSIAAPVYPDHRPVSLGDRAFRDEVAKWENGGVEVAIRYTRKGYESPHGIVVAGDTRILPLDHPHAWENVDYLTDRIATGLVLNGAHTLSFSGPPDLGERLQAEFSTVGRYAWVVNDLLGKSYDKPFKFIISSPQSLPRETSIAGSTQIRAELEGYVLGFDIGASDIKAALTLKDLPVWAEKVDWDPKGHDDPSYHHEVLRGLMMQANGYVQQQGQEIAAFGGSSSGVWVDDRLKIGNVARAVVDKYGDEGLPRFNREVFDALEKEFRQLFTILNDGGTTALAGNILIPGATGVHGVAFGSHEGGGYVYPDGTVTSQLWELAFSRVDRSSDATVCKWSHLPGIGGEYFCQNGTENLLPNAGIDVNELKPYISLEEANEQKMAQPAILKGVRGLAEAGDQRAIDLFSSLGVVLGYAIPTRLEYCGETSHVLVLGRVAKGIGGELIVSNAQRVLSEEFPDVKAHLVNTEAPEYQGMMRPDIVAAFKKIDRPLVEFMQAYAAAQFAQPRPI